MAGIEMRSAAFNDHDLMPDRVSREAGNLSPALEWSPAPEGTSELVLLCEDADAGDPPLLHWLVTGIDPASTGVPEGGVPAAGQEWRNDFGETGYAGPNPPRGDSPHRYFFRVFAVAEPLSLPSDPGSRDVHRAVRDRELASGVIVGTFGR